MGKKCYFDDADRQHTMYHTLVHLLYIQCLCFYIAIIS